MPSKHRKLMFIAFSLHARPCANRKCLYWLSYIILTSALGRDHYHLHSPPPPPAGQNFLNFFKSCLGFPAPGWSPLSFPPHLSSTTPLSFRLGRASDGQNLLLLPAQPRQQCFPSLIYWLPRFWKPSSSAAFSPKMGKYQGGKWGAQGTKLKELSLPGASCALARKGSFNLPNMPHPRPSPAPIVPLPSPKELPVLWNSHGFAWWILSLVCVMEAGFDSCNECPSSFFLCSQFQNQQGARLSHMQSSSCSPPALFCLLP